MQPLILESPSEFCTDALGRSIGELLEPGDVLALRGGLGAGKTFLAGAVARGLGIPPEIHITSPTFTFINEYDGRLHLYHLDLYRLGEPDELETLPWREALFGAGAAIIEWPDRLWDMLPADRWDIHLEPTGESTRRITLEARGIRNCSRMPHWVDIVTGLRTSAACR
jgi:tRNA threonylcarbamoyladenosine biosynthesis protein TsaE